MEGVTSLVRDKREGGREGREEGREERKRGDRKVYGDR